VITEAAERLVAEWAGKHHNLTGAYELALADFVLTKLADPRSGYDAVLEEICQRRWFVGQAVAS
jgi:hypothetical protein